MTAPTLTHTGQRFADEFAGPLEVDAEHGYAFTLFLSVLARAFDQVADISRDGDDGRPGYARLFNAQDADDCPATFLPFVGQFVGVEMLPGLTEAQQRLRIRETDGFKRGTPEAIRGAARQFLVGPSGAGDDATVFLNERQGGAYKLGVSTLVSETPDPGAVLRALLEQKPAGILLTYTAIAGGDYATLKGTHTDYADVKAEFADYAELRADPSQT